MNDTGGMERNALGMYFDVARPDAPVGWNCHYVSVGGVQVPAAKRPSTKSFPYPGVVNINSRIRWLPVNPYVEIANDSPFDPRIGAAPGARFTFSVGLNTLWVDATASEGDIIQYIWDLNWTTVARDAAGTSPTAEFPLAFEGVPPTSGRITLTVVGRDGQVDTISDRVNFRRLPRPFPIISGVPNPN